MHRGMTENWLGMHKRDLLATIAALIALYIVITLVQARLIDGLSQATQRLLDAGITDYVFDDEHGRPLDDQSLSYFIEQVNGKLAVPHQTHWLSPWRHEGSQVVSIDHVTPAVTGMDTARGISHVISIVRGGRERSVQIISRLSLRWSAVGIWSACFLALSFLVVRLVPTPLNQHQIQWLAYLRRQRDWPSDRALTFIRQHFKPNVGQALDLDRTDRLVSQCGLEVEESLKVLSDGRIAELTPKRFEWFMLGLRLYKGDPVEALRVAMSDNVMVIDPRNKSLSIHGLDVEMDHASLAVLAWYAMRRLKGDGWINNPPANLGRKTQLSGEDLENKNELMDLFERIYDVHGRSVDSIEKGVAAKFLNNHRSKITKALKAALQDNDQLMRQFCFEEQPIKGIDRRRFRLITEPESLQLHL